MFVYFKVAVDKLPAWSNFWQGMENTIIHTPTNILKVSLTSIEDFDTQTTEFFTNVKKDFDYVFHRRKLPLGENTILEKISGIVKSLMT